MENETAFEFQTDFASKRHCRDFTKHGEGFVLAAFKKGRAEVSEKQLTSSQLKELTAAKHIEVNKYIKQAVVKATEEAFTIPESTFMKMRWAITLKEVPGQDPKVKARLCILGFQSPDMRSARRSPPLHRHAGARLCSYRTVRGDAGG